MSFAFRTLTDEWRMEDGIVIREILDMTIREVSIVSFPAYPQTSVEVAQRSLDAFRRAHKGNRLEWLRKWHKTRLA
jgi:phage head maturation protease